MAHPSLSKYQFGTPVEARHHPGSHIIGRHPGNGLPVRGTRDPLLRSDAIDRMPITGDYCAGMFRMWIPEELANYLAIMDRATNKMYQLTDRVKIPVHDVPGCGPDGKAGEHLQIWLEWRQFYAEADGASDQLPVPGSY